MNLPRCAHSLLSNIVKRERMVPYNVTKSTDTCADWTNEKRHCTALYSVCVCTYEECEDGGVLLLWWCNTLVSPMLPLCVFKCQGLVILRIHRS